MRYRGEGMGVALAVALAVFFGAHVALVAGLARRHSWKMALSALVVAPLAPFWGWRRGMRARTIAWLSARVVYALGTILGALLSGP